MKKKLGDRYDGRRVRNCDPFNIIIPFIMRERNDSQVLFDAEIDVSNIDEAIREKRRNGETIGFLDYFITALVRTMSQYPRLNRFIAGRRLYARDEIRISLVVKKEMNINTEETSIKFKFDPNDTVSDVSRKLKETINPNKGGSGEKNSTDKLVGALNHLPRCLFSFFLWFLRVTDYYGIMPKAIHEISPFHTSVFVTNFGSLGAEPIYHHIYNFGTTSIFIAFGNRRTQRMINKEGKIVERKVMKLRFVADERISDGFYLASSLKYFSSLFTHPELLEEKPEKVLEDDQL